jgi:tetratricopeptide (TPR) repeat protein
LRSLEQQELIYQNRMTSFPGAREFVFRYNRLRNLAYESIPQTERMAYHTQAALWLERQSEPHADEYASLIADHFERAENVKLAATWYGRAAAHAQETYAAETAIQLYQQALSLLPDVSAVDSLPILYNEALGELLRWRARYDEAMQAFRTMQTAAHHAGDAAAETRALIGIFLTQDFQGDYVEALASSQQAEEVARASGSSEQLAVALAARAWSLARLDDVDAALVLAREALALSTAAAAQREIAYCNGLIGNICRIQRWYQQASKATHKALATFRVLDDRMWVELMLGNLGHIAFARRDYPAAVIHYEESLRIAQDIGEFYGAMRSLRKLGRIAQLGGRTEQATHCYQQAFVLAEKSGNGGYAAYIANELGTLFLTMAVALFDDITDIEKDAYVQQAHTWLGRALRLAREADIPHTVATAKSGTARLLLVEGRPDEALAFAQESIALTLQLSQNRPGRITRKTAAAAWHVLGQVAAELPPESLPVVVAERKYDAAACFGQGVRLYEQIGHGVEAELAYALHAWAAFELSEGDKKHGAALWRRALAMFAHLGMEKEASWMKRSHS